MLTQVKSYRTSDNQLFEDKVQATSHEFLIALRGIFQNETTSSMSTTQAATILAKNQEKVYELLRKHRDCLGRIARRNKPV